MAYPVRSLQIPLWRMLPIAYQRSPMSGEGARLYGGRWNRRGSPALYLSIDPATAVPEFYQGIRKPGTLAPYLLDAAAIVDLTDGKGAACDRRVLEALKADWKTQSVLSGQTPPSWLLADELQQAGAEGALVPSAQNPGWSNLVLWHLARHRGWTRRGCCFDVARSGRCAQRRDLNRTAAVLPSLNPLPAPLPILHRPGCPFR